MILYGLGDTEGVVSGPAGFLRRGMEGSGGQGSPPGFLDLNSGGSMRRMRVNKRRSASKFRRQVGRTKMINLGVRPMRGGFRL